MNGPFNGRPFDRVIEAVVQIAENLGCELPESSGNRLADALEAIVAKTGEGTPDPDDDEDQPIKPVN